MRKLIAILLLFASLSGFAQGRETSLFDSSGEPIAYIAEELTIYLWSGEPVAYLHPESSKLHVYGFNGKHLGWYSNGLLRDHEGDAVGGIREAFSSHLSYEPYKSYKQYKPYKSYREYAPYQPYFSRSWSELPLKFFLLQGVSD